MPVAVGKQTRANAIGTITTNTIGSGDSFSAAVHVSLVVGLLCMLTCSISGSWQQHSRLLAQCRDFFAERPFKPEPSARSWTGGWSTSLLRW